MPQLPKKKTLACGRPAAPIARAPTAARLAQWQEQLRSYLVAQKLKYSEQRWKIAEAILRAEGHLDAQGILAAVKVEHPEIGAATVYRSLKVLCDAKILKESLLGSHGQAVYEHFDDDHHDHIVCVDCGEIFEFHSDRIEKLQNEITQDMGFKQTRHRHVVYAQCEYLKKLSGQSA